MKILLDSNNVLVDFSETIEHRANGVSINGSIYPVDVLGLTLKDVASIPVEIKPQEYCYTETDGFYKNPNYVPYISPEVEIRQLKEQVTALNIAMAQILGV